MRFSSDEEVLAGIRSGGEACNSALRYLYKVNLPMVSRYITQNSGRAEDAQDKFQNAVIVFYEHVCEGRFEGRSSIRSYLLAIVRNMWLNELKRKGLNEKYTESLLPEAQDMPDTPHAVFVSGEHAAVLDAVVQQLGEGCRNLVRWRFWQYKPMKEIAELMGYKNEQVAKNKQQKCLESLRQLILHNKAAGEILAEYV